MDPVLCPITTTAGKHVHCHPNSASTCHILSYSPKIAGVSLTSAAALTMCATRSSLESIPVSRTIDFMKPLKKKKNLGRSGQETVPARQWAHPTSNQAIVVMTNPSWTERSLYPFPSIPSSKTPPALKRSAAAHRFLNKICYNEGYLSGPKVCRSNLETPCIFYWSCSIAGKEHSVP